MAEHLPTISPRGGGWMSIDANINPGNAMD